MTKVSGWLRHCMCVNLDYFNPLYTLLERSCENPMIFHEKNELSKLILLLYIFIYIFISKNPYKERILESCQLLTITLLTSWYLILTDVSILSLTRLVIPAACIATFGVHLATVLFYSSMIIWLIRRPSCQAQWLSASVVEFTIKSASKNV